MKVDAQLVEEPGIVNVSSAAHVGIHKWVCVFHKDLNTNGEATFAFCPQAPWGGQIAHTSNQWPQHRLELHSLKSSKYIRDIVYVLYLWASHMPDYIRNLCHHFNHSWFSNAKLVRSGFTAVWRNKLSDGYSNPLLQWHSGLHVCVVMLRPKSKHSRNSRTVAFFTQKLQGHRWSSHVCMMIWSH